MKKRLLAATLAASMVVSLAACGGNNGTSTDSTTANDSANGETKPAVESTGEGQLIIGNTTELQGDWSPYWSNGGSDYAVWKLIQGYSTSDMNSEGESFWDETVVKNVEETAGDDGSKTFTFTINEGLKYNNGEEITAKDYVASALLFDSKLLVDNGASTTTYGYYWLGWSDYNTGASDKFTGVRLLGDYEFSITVDPQYLPYYYEKEMLSVGPTDLEFWLGEGADVADDGDGAYMKLPESLDDATIAANIEKARYAVEDQVSCGPYKLASYDESSKTATLVVNPEYAGNYEGQKPSIGTLIYKKVEEATEFDELKTGSVDLLSELSTGDEINAGLDLVEQGGFAYNAYDRNGYGQLVFACDFGPTQFVKVRQAIAKLLDRNEFCKTFTSGYGSVVNGMYGTGMWQYQELKDELDSDLDTYSYSLDEAIKLLEDDGWVYDENGNAYTEGIRYKKLDDGTLMPLVIEWLSSEANSVSELLVTQLQNNPDVAKAGMKINQTVVTFSELLNYYYRSSDDAKYTEPTYNMFNMATGFTSVFDPSTNFTTDEDMIAQGYNNNYIRDEELDKLAKAIALTDPSDKEGYLANFLAFQKKWNELLPNLPLYSNEYHDFFNEKLQNYNANSMWDLSYAILYANVTE
ncbi:ABC transporter substrate-binding protein [Falcatimonas sp. MSJ-15]|uniref:ABC transporter substrate-binding protein n=1 Tax=Falcatimonas sp. MSJ-15 TaxID=2841515 RepID=UPI001C109E99|nr:ABC transporter substrate-binding protein [Falcatimonas sp. MSJ-15]MBU5469031.1 ABC transporter substrate-binding protein [Falcatimonas sp. MSJ-15]